MELTRDLETITRQERDLIFAHFDPEIAWQLGLRLRDLAVSRHHAVAIEVRRFGQQLFYSARGRSVVRSLRTRLSRTDLTKGGSSLK
jgi:uncharacterized protein (UPF0303 family)